MFEYENYDDSAAGKGLTVNLRRDGSDQLILETRVDRIRLREVVGRVGTTLDQDLAADSLEGTRYRVRAVMEGTGVTVYWGEAGGPMTEVLSATTQITDTTQVSFSCQTDEDFGVDNVRILADDLSRTTTFTVNNANEMTAMTDYNGRSASRTTNSLSGQALRSAAPAVTVGYSGSASAAAAGGWGSLAFGVRYAIGDYIRPYTTAAVGCSFPCTF